MSCNQACHICWYWKPIHWEGWHWVDVEATCSFDSELHSEGDVCGAFTITRPAQVAKRNAYVGTLKDLKPGDMMAEMEAWYNANQAQFHMDNVKEAHVEGELYEHQSVALERYKESSEIALFFEMGCIAGDVPVKYSNSLEEKCSPIRLDNLYAKFHSGDGKNYFTRGSADGTLLHVRIKDIVYQGKKHCIRVFTETGKSVALTTDHEVLTPGGWVEAGRIKLDDYVMANGLVVCSSCGLPFVPEGSGCGNIVSMQCSSCTNNATPTWGPDKEELDKFGRMVTYGKQTEPFPSMRQRGGIPTHRFVMAKHLGRPLESYELVHHKDEDKLNNSIDNLEILTQSEHAAHHQAQRVAPVAERVVRIDDIGEQKTYDLKCESPHNFVAGGIIVHNCGKSATALAIAAYKFRKGDINSLLIVAPNDVHKQWAVEQVPRWLPADINREVQCFGGRGGAKDTHPFWYPDYLHIVCVNIDTFSTPKKWMDIAEWVGGTKCMIILDEATTIKSQKSKRTERMLYEFNDTVKRGKRVVSTTPKTVARAILTGTPATNGAMDLWSLMEFLRPNFFGRNWYSFRNYYGMLSTVQTPFGGTQVMINEERWQAIKNIQEYTEAYAVFGVSLDTFDTIHAQDHYQGAYKHLEELKGMVDTVAMYKLLKDCVDMPAQNYNRRLVTMSPAQAQAYSDMEEQLLALYGGAQTTAANKITAMIRLQQISSGFIVNSAIAPSDPEFQDSGIASMYLIDEEEESDYDLEPGEVVWLGDTCPKMEMMFNDIEEASLPCIIVTRFSAEAARIYDELSKTHSCCLMTGWKRIGTIDEFKEGKYEIMVANIRVISKGFNLQVSHQMFFYSNTFSLEDRLQAEGRIFRIGQTDVCSYTDYVNDGTIDLKVVGALRQKRALLDYIRGTSLTAFVKDEDEVVAIENAELAPVAPLTDQQVLLNTAMADVKEFAKSFLEEA